MAHWEEDSSLGRNLCPRGLGLNMEASAPRDSRRKAIDTVMQRRDISSGTIAKATKISPNSRDLDFRINLVYSSQFLVAACTSYLLVEKNSKCRRSCIGRSTWAGALFPQGVCRMILESHWTAAARIQGYVLSFLNTLSIHSCGVIALQDMQRGLLQPFQTCKSCEHQLVESDPTDWLSHSNLRIRESGSA